MREETQNFRRKVRFLITCESWENEEQCLLVLTHSSSWITPYVEVRVKLVKPHFIYYRKTSPFCSFWNLDDIGRVGCISPGHHWLWVPASFLLFWSPLDKDLNPFKFPNVLLYCSRILSFSWFSPHPFPFCFSPYFRKGNWDLSFGNFSCLESTGIYVKNPVIYLSGRKEYSVICHQN